MSYILTDITRSLMEGRLGINVQDAEGFLNPIYKDTWKEALKEHYKDSVMGKVEEPPPPAETPQSTQEIIQSIRNMIGK